MFDSLAVAAIRDELQDLVGGRVQRVVQTEPLSLGLELYAGGQRRWLICSADPRRAGAWVVDDKLGQSPAPPSPILLLCRKYL
ncbi:MAG TPA: NFACT family protein, partial [Chloroflexota bacterium]